MGGSSRSLVGIRGRGIRALIIPRQYFEVLMHVAEGQLVRWHTFVDANDLVSQRSRGCHVCAAGEVRLRKVGMVLVFRSKEQERNTKGKKLS